MARHEQIRLTPTMIEQESDRFSVVVEDLTGTKLSIPWIGGLGRAGESATARIIHDKEINADYIVWVTKNADGEERFLSHRQFVKGIDVGWNESAPPEYDPREKDENEAERMRAQALQELSSRFSALLDAKTWPPFNDGRNTNLKFVIRGERSPLAPPQQRRR